MDRRLVEAALRGNETTLNALIQEDPFILHRISLTTFVDNPLHMASLCGNIDFVTAILGRKPEFLTKTDSFGRCPLHLACAEGHVEIVKKLFQACPDVAQRQDQDGRTPLELAALNEQVGVLTYLLQENPLLAKMATAPDSRETILHLCIRHSSIEALKLLVGSWDRDEVINSQDEDGNNLLHVAVNHKQIQIVKYLLGEVGSGENWNSMNRDGFTAVDVLDRCPRDWRTVELHGILVNSGVRRTNELNIQNQSNNLFVSQETGSTITPILPLSLPGKVRKFLKNVLVQNFKDWPESIHGNLLVAATVIATISFQAGLNPPGGVWQDSNNNGHIAGTSIMVSTDSEIYTNFVWDNTIALVLSSSIIVLTVIGFPLNSQALMPILMAALMLTIVAMWSTYNLSVLCVSSAKDMPKHQVHQIISIVRFATYSTRFVVLAMVALSFLARWLAIFV